MKLSQNKQEIRKQIALHKCKYTLEELAGFSEKIFGRLISLKSFQTARTIFIYHSLNDEVYTHTFIDTWKNKKDILLPIVSHNELELCLLNNDSTFRKGKFGILEPVGETFVDYSSIDLAIIPGVAFDKACNRLGRGKGFYDRILPQLQCPKIGICFSFQLIDLIPCEPHDIPMDIIITENEMISL